MDRFERLRAALLDVDSQDIQMGMRDSYVSSKNTIIHILKKRDIRVSCGLESATVEQLESELAKRKAAAPKPDDSILWGFRPVCEDTFTAMPQEEINKYNTSGIVTREGFFLMDTTGAVYGVDCYDRIFYISQLSALPLKDKEDG